MVTLADQQPQNLFWSSEYLLMPKPTAKKAINLKKLLRRETALGLNFNARLASLASPWPSGRWVKLTNSAETKCDGPGSLPPQPLQAQADFTLTQPPYSLIRFASLKGEY